MEIDEYREIINRFSFDRCKRGNQGYNRILIQLFGLLGHGKSSFINTCKYVWEDGEYRNWAKAYDDDGGAKTTVRIPYVLTRNITLVDNRGCKFLDDYETGEIFAQLANLLPLGVEVQWNTEFSLNDRIVSAESEVTKSDFIVPVFVHSVKRIITNKDKEEFKSLIETATNLTGVYPIVVLTHKTSGRLSDTEATFRDIGVEHIFSFENYTPKNHHKTRGTHKKVMKFLYEIIKDVQFRVEQPINPAKEMIERKQFVMKYIHDREIRIEKEKILREAALERIRRERNNRQDRQEKAEQRQNQRNQDHQDLDQ